jgi:hypothetical protein
LRRLASQTRRESSDEREGSRWVRTKPHSFRNLQQSLRSQGVSGPKRLFLIVRWYYPEIRWVNATEDTANQVLWEPGEHVTMPRGMCNVFRLRGIGQLKALDIPMGSLRTTGGGKTGGLMRGLGRWWALYQAIAFMALIAIMSYYVIVRGLPKKILLICIPGYTVLALGSHQIYRAL